MKLEIRDPKKDRADAFVVFAATENGGSSYETIPAELRDAVRTAAPRLSGGEGAVFTVPLSGRGPADRVYVFGAGKRGEVSPRRARSLLRGAIRTLNANGETSAIFDAP